MDSELRAAAERLLADNYDYGTPAGESLEWTDSRAVAKACLGHEQELAALRAEVARLRTLCAEAADALPDDASGDLYARLLAASAKGGAT